MSQKKLSLWNYSLLVIRTLVLLHYFENIQPRFLLISFKTFPSTVGHFVPFVTWLRTNVMIVTENRFSDTFIVWYLLRLPLIDSCTFFQMLLIAIARVYSNPFVPDIPWTDLCLATRMGVASFVWLQTCCSWHTFSQGLTLFDLREMFVHRAQ